MLDLPRLQASFRSVWGGRLLQAVTALGIALASLVAGLALAVIGERFGAGLILVLPAGALLAAVIFSRPALGIAAIFASFPAGFVHLPTDALGLQAVEITVLLVLGVVVLRRVASRLSPLPWAPQMSFAVLLVAWALIATPSALDHEVAVKQSAQLAGGVLLALAVPAALRGTGDVRRALAVLLVVGGGVVAFGLRSVSSIQTEFGGAVGVNRATGVFTQPNDYGAFAAMLLMLAVGWTLAATTSGGRLGGASVGGVAMFGLAFSLSRGAWIGTLFGVVALLVLLPQARRALLLFGVPAAVLGTLLIVTLTPPEQPQIEAVRRRLESLARPNSNPYDARPAIYREAIRQIRTDPATGVGPGNFPFASARAGSLARTVGAAHAHNLLLTSAAELGIPGALLVVALMIALALLARRLARNLGAMSDRALMAGVAAALFVHAGQGIVDFTLRNPVLSVLTWALVGFLLVGRREAQGEAERVTGG